MSSNHSGKSKFDIYAGSIKHVMERIIAVFTVLVLVYVLCAQIWEVAMHPGHLLESEGLGHFLHQVLTIVVGLEFVELLLHVTPENVLEVMIMAIARHFVVGNCSALEIILNVVAVILCIAAIEGIKYLRIKKKMPEANEEF